MGAELSARITEECFYSLEAPVLRVGGGDDIVVRQVTTLALSFDHRHVDGEKGSRFLADVTGIVEDPATALLF